MIYHVIFPRVAPPVGHSHQRGLGLSGLVHEEAHVVCNPTKLRLKSVL